MTIEKMLRMTALCLAAIGLVAAAPVRAQQAAPAEDNFNQGITDDDVPF